MLRLEFTLSTPDDAAPPQAATPLPDEITWQSLFSGFTSSDSNQPYFLAA